MIFLIRLTFEMKHINRINNLNNSLKYNLIHTKIAQLD